jgi:hypothetical protein
MWIHHLKGKRRTSKRLQKKQRKKRKNSLCLGDERQQLADKRVQHKWPLLNKLL